MFTREELLAAVQYSNGKTPDPEALDSFDRKARAVLAPRRRGLRAALDMISPRSWLALAFLGFVLGVIALDRLLKLLF